MPLKLTLEALREIFPKAPAEVLNAFVARQHVLDEAGITQSRTRLAHFFANIEHECDGFALKGLTENINYTAGRMAQVWPNRFKSAAAVVAKYGATPGWQKKAFDDIYGNRMGNRPGTSDGSRFIGRGGPQWTGRDGYEELQRRTGLPVVANPEIACRLDVQPEVCAAFWSWKKLNQTADAGDTRATRKRWNGGYNGMSDVEARMRGNDAVVKQLRFIDAVKPILSELPGSVSSRPPQDVIDDAMKGARVVRNTAAGAAIGGAATSSVVEQPDHTVVPAVVSWGVVGVLVAAAVIAAVVVARRKAAIVANWW